MENPQANNVHKMYGLYYVQMLFSFLNVSSWTYKPITLNYFRENGIYEH